MNTHHDSITKKQAATPGPWQVIGTAIFQNHTPVACLTDDQLSRIASVETRAKFDPTDLLAPGSLDPEAEANARLIASAPDLLHALRLALGQLEGCKPLSGVHASSLRADLQIVRAAIARAEGRAS